MWRLPPTTIENSAIKIYFILFGVEKLAKEKGKYCGVSKPNNEIGKDCSGTKQRELGLHIGKNSIVDKLNPFKTKKPQTTTVVPEEDNIQLKPDMCTIREQKIAEYSNELTDMYTEKRDYSLSCMSKYRQTLDKRNEVYVKLMDGKNHVPDMPNIKAYFKNLDDRFAELSSSLEELKTISIAAMEECDELFQRLSSLNYHFISRRMVTHEQYKLELDDIAFTYKRHFEEDHLREYTRIQESIVELNKLI